MQTVLFLCTGNYYRSRFAEELFNHRMPQDAGWTAISRGLALERLKPEARLLSNLAGNALSQRGIAARGANRAPQTCTVADLESAVLTVALKEAEHRPLLTERFPGWEHRVTYWHVDDIDVGPADIATDEIERRVVALVARLTQAT